MRGTRLTNAWPCGHATPCNAEPMPRPATQDYLIAEGYNEALYKDGKIVFEAKYYYSQDGVKWVDLVPISAEKGSKAEKIKTALSGDPAKVCACL